MESVQSTGAFRFYRGTFFYFIPERPVPIVIGIGTKVGSGVERNLEELRGV